MNKPNSWPVTPVRYTDGALVKEGDLIRCKSHPGGIIPAKGPWAEGVAVSVNHEEFPGFQNIALKDANGTLWRIAGHIIEKREVGNENCDAVKR